MKTDHLKTARDVLLLEARALEETSHRLQKEQIDRLIHILKSLDGTGGNLVFSGIGKSGNIAQKISSTFCSLGCPSFFLHPVDALHGDMGRLRVDDVIVYISKSGSSKEILQLIPYVKIEKKRTIGLLGHPDSPLAEHCDLVLDCSVKKEAGQSGQAPTTSTTVALAMGDAMAVIYEKMTGLTKKGFVGNHPGGMLGKAMRLQVKNLLHPPRKCPVLQKMSTLKTAILEMTKFPVGGCAILSEDKSLLGIIVEGDIRRAFAGDKHDLNTPLARLMNKNPVTIKSDILAAQALEVMENKNPPLNILPVVDENGRFLGFIRLHDLLKEGFQNKQKSS